MDTPLYSLMDPIPNLPDICRRRHQGNARSVAANVRVHARKANLRERILAWLLARGEHGGTVDEYCAEADKYPNACSGRFSELAAAGQIRDTGRVRLTRSGGDATVWEAMI